MKIRFVIVIFLGLLNFSCSNKYKEVINLKTDYQLIPRPTSLKMLSGRFLVDRNTKIVGDIELKAEGIYLAEMLNLPTGVNIQFDSQSKNGNIVLKIDEPISNHEAYKKQGIV